MNEMKLFYIHGFLWMLFGYLKGFQDSPISTIFFWYILGVCAIELYGYIIEQNQHDENN